MKRSVRVAAKTVSIALVIVLVCAFALAALSALQGYLPQNSHNLVEHAFTTLGVGLVLAFVVALVSGFHIAVSAALDRMKDKNSSSGKET
jgi:ABC-type Na+ efflux pump permease subunit